MKSPIIVVGSYVQDLTFYTREFPAPGETVIGNFLTGPGGKGSNQAIAAKRSGGGVAFVGAVGGDAFAGVAKDFHKAEGIDARWLEDSTQTTGAASIIVNEAAQNEIVVSLGACNVMTETRIAEKIPEEAKIIVTQLETHPEATKVAMEKGRKMGAITVLNPAPMRDDFDPLLLKNVDILIPNETEFVSLLKLIDYETYGELSDQDLEELTAEELNELCEALGVNTVILTLGARGAFLSTTDRFASFLPLDDIKVVDTTGAGDAFVGGFSSGMVKFDDDLDRAIKHGILVAGLSVTRAGTAPAMPRESELLSYMEDHSMTI